MKWFRSRMGTSLLIIGISFLVLGTVNLSAQPIVAAGFLWFGGAFLAVGVSYFLHTPGIFGKRRRDGRLSPLAMVLLFPYLLLTYLIWEIKVRVREEPVFHEIAPNLFLERRPRSLRELPEGTAMIVDLTSEFAPARALLSEDRRYRCLPTLDHAAPINREKFAALVDEVAALDDAPVYVHCAVGRGRSALFVAAVLLARGLAADGRTAWEQVRAARSCVGLSAEQAAFLFDSAPEAA